MGLTSPWKVRTAAAGHPPTLSHPPGPAPCSAFPSLTALRASCSVPFMCRPKEVAAARTVRQRGVRLIASAHGNLRSLMKNSELNGLVGGFHQVLLGYGAAKDHAMERMKNKEEARKRSMLREQAAASQAEEEAVENGDGQGTGSTNTTWLSGGAAAPAQGPTGEEDAEMLSPRAQVDKMVKTRASESTFDVIIEVNREDRQSWRIIYNVNKAVDDVLACKEHIVERRTFPRDPKRPGITVTREPL